MNQRITLAPALLALALSAGACISDDPVDLGTTSDTESEESSQPESSAESEVGDPPEAASDESSCLQVAPQEIDFGAVVLGSSRQIEVTVANCGDVLIDVTSIELAPDGDAGFGLTVSAGDAPWSLAPGQSLGVGVTYRPSETSPLDAEGDPDRDVAQLLVRADGVSTLRVELSGYGITDACPVAVINVAEGDEVAPGTILHLIGSGSYSPLGDAVVSYEWSVAQPVGSQSVFVPSALVADPVFEANVSGSYQFELTVVDAKGRPSCSPARYQVHAVGEDRLHVELLWTGVGIAPPTDPTFPWPDVDLHVRRFDAAWFDEVGDCYWYNSAPDWGAPGPADDPWLDRDDTGGAGPENVSLNGTKTTEVCVGAHAWHLHGWEAAAATVRIYLSGVLSYQRSDVRLVANDMWEVACVVLEELEVIPTDNPDGSPRIIEVIAPFSEPD